MKRITIIMCAAALLLIAGCATATAEEPPTAKYGAFVTVNDVDEPAGAVRIVQEMEARQAAEAEAAAAEEEAAAELETYYEEDYSWVESYAPSYGSGDGFQQEGVREYNGRTETWYSSNQLYHYRTGEWSVDDEGYYRDDQGRYVVAVSENEVNPDTGEPYTEGDTIETSKGTGIVLDSGCDDGVTDFYTAF